MYDYMIRIERKKHNKLVYNPHKKNKLKTSYDRVFYFKPIKYPKIFSTASSTN